LGMVWAVAAGLIILAAGDWPLELLTGMRDWAAFPAPRDAMIEYLIISEYYV
jgi:hypothetical protein